MQGSEFVLKSGAGHVAHAVSRVGGHVLDSDALTLPDRNGPPIAPLEACTCAQPRRLIVE